MIADDFKELLSSLCGLSHHQRNVAKAALDRQTDLPEIIEVVETRFELKLACLIGLGLYNVALDVFYDHLDHATRCGDYVPADNGWNGWNACFLTAGKLYPA